MRYRETLRGPARRDRLILCLAVCSLALCSCSGPSHLHEILIESESGRVDRTEFVRDISRPIIDLLSRNEFECRTDYGHTLFYAACTNTDDSGIGQTTNTFVNIYYPDAERRVEITITTGQLSYHPFTRSNRKYFLYWRDLILGAIDSLPDVSYSDYEVD